MKVSGYGGGKQPSGSDSDVFRQHGGTCVCQQTTPRVEAVVVQLTRRRGRRGDPGNDATARKNKSRSVTATSLSAACTRHPPAMQPQECVRILEARATWAAFSARCWSGTCSTGADLTRRRPYS